MNEIKIEIPQNMVIDEVNSNLSRGVIKFKSIMPQLPKTWDEFCENVGIKPGESYMTINSDIYSYTLDGVKRRKGYDKYLLPDKETAEAMLALCQLIQLRDCYNGGWRPDWSNDKEKKYVIYISNNNITIGTNLTVSQILSFKTSMLRDEFLVNFRDLIETAKPLI